MERMAGDFVLRERSLVCEWDPSDEKKKNIWKKYFTSRCKRATMKIIRNFEENENVTIGMLYDEKNRDWINYKRFAVL